ncbi:MAG: tetratricopeptide repeat protein [Pseudonocardiaceae bacterium]
MHLHRLVQAILLSRQAGSAAGDGIAAVAVRLLRATVPAGPWNDPVTWPAWRQLLPHVLTVTSRDPKSADEDVAWLLDRAATYLQTQGSPRLARPLSEQAFELYQGLRGKDHPNTLGSANLAHALRALGEHQQARQLHEDTLTRCRRVLDEDHPHTLVSASNLAGVLHALGEHEQARQLEEYVRTHRKG